MCLQRIDDLTLLEHRCLESKKYTCQDYISSYRLGIVPVIFYKRLTFVSSVLIVMYQILKIYDLSLVFCDSR